MSRAHRMALIECGHRALSIAHQCALVGVSRSSRYYTPKGENADNEHLMRLIDEQYLKTPWYGARQMARHLKRQGQWVNRKRVRRLMAKMGLMSVYPRPKTSKLHPAHAVYPYLLRALAVNRPDQVWCADVTYIPLHRGFMYLIAIMDWYSRRVLTWRLSNTLEADFCVEALQEAIERFGVPEIFNTDQGCQFTSAEFTGVLALHGIRISMDGRGRWIDNVFIERLWRSLKYECVYLEAFESPRDARTKLDYWIKYYNHQRPHSSLENRTPDEAYQGIKPVALAA
jgi:putative transposase